MQTTLHICECYIKKKKPKAHLRSRAPFTSNHVQVYMAIECFLCACHRSARFDTKPDGYRPAEIPLFSWRHMPDTEGPLPKEMRCKLHHTTRLRSIQSCSCQFTAHVRVKGKHSQAQSRSGTAVLWVLKKKLCLIVATGAGRTGSKMSPFRLATPG